MKRLFSLPLYAVAALILLSSAAKAAPPVSFSEKFNAEFECQPIFQANTVPPNIMIIIDNSGSMASLAMPADQAYEGTPLAGDKTYYGYFNPDYFYQYSSNSFSHKYKKIQYVGVPNAGGYWEVEDLAGNPVNLTDALIETGNVSTGYWDGNFLNYVSMRRIDVVRKVMMGGKATSRTGGGNSHNQGYNGGYTWFDANLSNGVVDPFDAGVAVAPLGGNRIWELYNGYLQVYSSHANWWNFNYSDRMTIDVDKVEAYEPSDFKDGNLAGIFQKIGTRARWGNAWFDEGTGSNDSGGFIANVIGTNETTLITNLQNTGTDNWTPLAETLYVVTQYFAQEDVDRTATSDYASNIIPHTTVGQDPYHNGTEFVPCAKSFVILLTDGASTKDADIPAFLKNYDPDSNDNVNCNESTNTNCDYGSGGTNYLDDVALWARTTDLRSATKGKTEITGDQNLILYTVYANFGSGDANAISLLSDAAKNGGFDDKDGDNLPAAAPDPDEEWDKNHDTVPDTFYNAEDGYELESKLLSAINDILSRAASGTAVSVLATSNEGEGNVTQAFFKPQITVGTKDIEWLGYLQSFWVDKCGNLREDSANQPAHADPECRTNQPDQALNVNCDKIVAHFIDSTSGDTKIKRYDVSSANQYAQPLTSLGQGDDCTSSGTYPTATTIELDEASAVWQAGKKLAERPAADRKIITYIDKDDDGVVDDTSWTSSTIYEPPGSAPSTIVTFSQFDYTEEIVEFDIENTLFPQDVIAPFLGLADTTGHNYWDYLTPNATCLATSDTLRNRYENLISYIRGNDDANGCLRPRTFDYDSDGTNETWKLGDVVHSTPVAVSKPLENFHIIYSDETYQKFFDAYKDRETVVYIGANDGMLHAFTSWEYDSSLQKYTQPSGTTQDIGDELWAYIPQSLLPHLKWLPSNDYSHTYFVDMKPKIFDAKILPDDTHYIDSESPAELNWGTFMLIGFNLGGGTIQAKEDFNYNGSIASSEVRTFSPSYTLIDITEPRNPRIMWERSYEHLQASASVPAIIRVKDKWFAVFGSGPSGCSGESAQSSYLYVVDLLTGDPEDLDGGTDDWFYTTGSPNAFVNSPVSLDMKLNFNVDSIYFGENTKSGVNYSGNVHKIYIPWTCDPIISGNATYSAECVSNFATTDLPKKYCTNPLDPTGAKIACGSYTDVPQNWKTMKLYDTSVPVTAPLSLSLDSRDNVWIYGGTGRYYNDTDKIDGTSQYIFGIKDPFFDSSLSSYYLDYTPPAFTANILDTTNLQVTTTGKVYDSSTSSYYGSTGLLSELEEDIGYDATPRYNGWKQTITGGERIINKPTLLGGIVFVPSFTPSTTICSYGGTSNLYGLYYTTGTAYSSSVFNQTTDTALIGSETVFFTRHKKSLGQGLSSSMAVHVGAEANAKGLIQQSTGEIISEMIDPALNIKSRIYYWLQE